MNKAPKYQGSSSAPRGYQASKSYADRLAEAVTVDRRAARDMSPHELDMGHVNRRDSNVNQSTDAFYKNLHQLQAKLQLINSGS
jgi:hypothetical protein